MAAPSSVAIVWRHNHEGQNREHTLTSSTQGDEDTELPKHTAREPGGQRAAKRRQGQEEQTVRNACGADSVRIQTHKQALAELDVAAMHWPTSGYPHHCTCNMNFLAMPLMVLNVVLRKPGRDKLLEPTWIWLTHMRQV